MKRIGTAEYGNIHKKVNGKTRKRQVRSKYIYYVPTFTAKGSWKKTAVCRSDDGCSYSITNATLNLNTLTIGATSGVVKFDYSYTFGSFKGTSYSNSIKYGSWGEYRHGGVLRTLGSTFYPRIDFKSKSNCTSRLEVDKLKFKANLNGKIWHSKKGKTGKTGKKVVYFGKPGCLRKKSLSNGAICTKSKFGRDPLPGITKYCYIEK